MPPSRSKAYVRRTPRVLPAVCLSLGMCFLNGGCMQRNELARSPAVAAQTDEPESNVSPSNAPLAETSKHEVTLAAMSLTELPNEIARHQGKLVLLNLWALW